jgi:hypothetical protein
MDVADHAFAVRPGEHACCRFEHARFEVQRTIDLVGEVVEGQ